MQSQTVPKQLEKNGCKLTVTVVVPIRQISWHFHMWIAKAKKNVLNFNFYDSERAGNLMFSVFPSFKNKFSVSLIIIIYLKILFVKNFLYKAKIDL